MRAVERIAWIAALLALGTWAYLRFDAMRGTQRELDRFASARSAAAAAVPATATEIKPPDFRLWSPHAVQQWKHAQSALTPPPLGVLRLSRLQIEAPILEGTDDAILDRGVGHIEDTAAPGTPGNSGLAGHRDSFFRALKDIVEGDILEVQTLTGVATYKVERTWIVEPDDVSVLDPTPTPAITLVTCYPFYFIGSAPRRFIVRATRLLS